MVSVFNITEYLCDYLIGLRGIFASKSFNIRKIVKIYLHELVMIL
jgi:hypothetical protein